MRNLFLWEFGFLRTDKVLEVAIAILTVYTENGLDEGLRANRAKARLMWLVETWGVETFRAEIEKELGYALR